MKTKILIAEHKERAEMQIKELNKKAEQMTELVKVYNELPIINSLTIKKDVFDFFSNPIEWFNNSILNDTGITFSEKATPAPEQVAKMFNIPYEPVINKIYHLKKIDPYFYDFDDKRTSIYITEKGKEKIYEQAKQYIEDEAEIRAYNLISKLCDINNEFIDRFMLDNTSVNQIAHALKLNVTSIDKKYRLIPNYSYIQFMFSNINLKNKFLG